MMFWLGLAGLLAQPGQAAPSQQPRMVAVPAGTYLPFLQSKDSKATSPEERRPVAVAAFLIEAVPVTRARFLDFVKTHPVWRRSRIKSVFADSHYLADWRGDLVPTEGDLNAPVTQVSWFAANAYCEAGGLELPTVDQWEYAAYDAGRGADEIRKHALDWYARPNPRSLPAVGGGTANGYGIQDLFGLVWEWTQDFNSAIVSDEARESGTADNNLFCASGALGALDATDYVSFMRFSFRGSLKARYTTSNLGFRCAKAKEGAA